MADPNKQNITIKFGSWTLPMSVPRQDEHFYREAERLMKERYSFYTNNYKGQSTEMYLVMTLLDITVRLQRTKEHGDPTPLLEKLQPLIDEIEGVLDSK